MNLVSNKNLIGLILVSILNPVSLAQENSNGNEAEFLPDKSDVTQALSSKTFQIQGGISFSQTDFDGSTFRQFTIPFLITRYGITNNFLIQAKSELDLNEYFVNEMLMTQEYQINYLLFGFLYQPTQNKHLIFFDTIAFLLDNLIPFNSSINFDAEFDVVFTTNLSQRFSLEYGLGYGYRKNNGGYTNFSFQLEANLTRNINCEIIYANTFFLENGSRTKQNSLGLEVDFVTMYNYQINFTYTYGLQNQSSYVNGVFIYTF